MHMHLGMIAPQGPTPLTPKLKLQTASANSKHAKNLIFFALYMATSHALGGPDQTRSCKYKTEDLKVRRLFFEALSLEILPSGYTGLPRIRSVDQMKPAPANRNRRLKGP